MNPELLPLALGVPLGLVAVWAGFRLLRSYDSAPRFRREPIPATWWPIVLEHLPLAGALAADERERLLRYTQVFLAEKRFEGCDGLELTEEMKIAIASTACFLIVNSGDSCYPRVTTVLVYPATFIGRRAEWPGRSHRLDVEGEDPTSTVPLEGEAWLGGTVILGWAHVEHGGADPHDGENVVLHEFAHQLDYEDGVSNGIPDLEGRADPVSWEFGMKKEFQALRQAIDRSGYSGPMSEYGATNESEFFAVATETFFEKPTELKAAHRVVYELLRQYYRLDPAGMRV